jgi:SAM-dependent methyltransferase
MPDALARTSADRIPVVYAGRFFDQVARTDLPFGCEVLGEQDSLSHKLTEVLERANALVLLDLPSFPLQAMTDDHWGIPLTVLLPPALDASSLATTFGPTLFERLGFFDQIVAQDVKLWEELRQKYRWSESQRVPVSGDHPGEVARTVCALLGSESMSASAPQTGDASRDLRDRKDLQRVQSAALEPRFAAAREKRDNAAPLDVLEVGTGAGRWATKFDPAETRFVGIDARQDLLGAARANFPERTFDLLRPDLLFPYEDRSFDLVFCVTVMHHSPTPAKKTLVSEMWRVARPGGRLLFLEDLVSTRWTEKPDVYPMSVMEFADLILDATVGRVVLEHVESLRYPGEELYKGGLISLLRLGGG